MTGEICSKMMQYRYQSTLFTSYYRSVLRKFYKFSNVFHSDLKHNYVDTK